MSRDQQNQTFDTSQEQQKEAYKTSVENEQSAQDAIAKYVASNPYTKGGEFDTDTDTALSTGAEVGADAVRNQVQEQAQRTGQNMTAANATAARAAQASTRDLAAAEATADQNRIAASDARGTVPINAETALYNGATNASGQNLNVQEEAAKTPSFLDEFGNSVASGLGGLVTGKNLSVTKML